MFSRPQLMRPVRKWINSRLEPTSSYLIRHPDRWMDFRTLTGGLREVVPHPRLFFLIILPGSLHIASLACQLVPPDVRLVVILCSLDAWEENWARANLKSADPEVSLQVQTPRVVKSPAARGPAAFWYRGLRLFRVPRRLSPRCRDYR